MKKYLSFSFLFCISMVFGVQENNSQLADFHSNEPVFRFLLANAKQINCEVSIMRDAIFDQQSWDRLINVLMQEYKKLSRYSGAKGVAARNKLLDAFINILLAMKQLESGEKTGIYGKSNLNINTSNSTVDKVNNPKE